MVAIVSAVIAAGSLSVAALQYLVVRRKSISDSERLAGLAERLRTAVTSARAATQAADLIVQRTKQPDTTMVEVRNLARLARGTLALLRDQLEAEERQVVAQQDHRSLFTSAPGDDDRGTPELAAG
jgi:hypothetical protein